MARIEFCDIAHSYVNAPASERDYALQPVDLVWQNAGAYALLGPSGCGKSTLLNIISGLLRPSRGAIVIDGRDVTHLPPQARNIAQVFQFPVIYDTMSVFDNLAFPLRNRGIRGVELKQRVERVADLLELEPWLARRATGLTADLKQRISLGRGLVRVDVAAILLDEPLTVIDPHAKWLLRRKLKQIHSELGVTLVYVTHDQVEALTLADSVAVMNEGRILQLGSAQELFERPAHTFVGYFIGSPGMNLLPCELEADSARIRDQPIALPAELCARARARGGEFLLGVRPEFLVLRSQATPGRTLAGVVSLVEHLGHAALVTLHIGPHKLVVKTRDDALPAAGDERWVEFPETHTLLYARASQEIIA
jgi:glycerol transport system ATP-binding protein